MCIRDRSIPICNHFHTRRADSGKITSLFDALVRGHPLTHGYEMFSLQTRVLVAAHSEDFVILGVVVLIHCQDVTDGQTDRCLDDG